MKDKSHFARGKLSIREVNEMRRLRPMMTLLELGARFGVSKVAVYRYVKGITGPNPRRHYRRAA